MCKTPKWERIGLPLVSAVLMLSELPNWLLFRALEGEKSAALSRLTAVYRQTFLVEPAIPQAFPQPAALRQRNSNRLR
jgi:hypothetical protein